MISVQIRTSLTFHIAIPEIRIQMHDYLLQISAAISIKNCKLKKDIPIQLSVSALCTVELKSKCLIEETVFSAFGGKCWQMDNQKPPKMAYFHLIVCVCSLQLCDFIRRAPILQFLAISMQKQPTSDISVSHCVACYLSARSPKKIYEKSSQFLNFSLSRELAIEQDRSARQGIFLLPNNMLILASTTTKMHFYTPI